MPNRILNRVFLSLFRKTQFLPSSSSLLPCYSFLARLDNEDCDFSILTNACKQAVVKLLVIRNVKSEAQVYLAGDGNNRANQLPIDVNYVNLQLALIISEVCHTKYLGALPSLIAFDNDILDSEDNANLYPDFNFSDFQSALTNFDESFKSLAVKADSKLFEKAKKLVDECKKLANVNTKSRKRASEIEMIFGLLGSTVENLLSALFVEDDFVPPKIKNCESFDLTDTLDETNYVRILTSLATYEHAAKMFTLESDAFLPRLSELVEFDRNGMLSLKTDFPALFADKIIEVSFTNMQVIASSFNQMIKAITNMKQFTIDTLLVNTAQSISNSDMVETFAAICLTKDTEKVMSLQKKVSDAVDEIAALNKKVQNGFNDLYVMIGQYYGAQSLSNYFERFKCVCGFYNSTPIISKVVDIERSRRKIKLLKVSASTRKKKIFEADFFGEELSGDVLAIDCAGSAGSAHSVLRNKNAESTFKVDCFYNKIPVCDLKGGKTYSSSTYGCVFKGNVTDVRNFVSRACLVLTLQYSTEDHKLVGGYSVECVTIKPPSSSLTAIYVGTKKRCVSGVSYQCVSMKPESADIMDVIFSFSPSIVDEANMEELYMGRVRLLCSDLESRRFIDKVKFVDNLSFELGSHKGSEDDGSNNPDLGGVAGLQTFFGKRMLSKIKLGRRSVIVLPYGVTASQIFDNKMVRRSEPIDPERVYSFKLPSLLLPSVIERFEIGDNEITGAINRFGNPIYKITQNDDSTCSIIICVDITNDTLHSGVIQRLDESSNKVTINYAYQNPMLTKEMAGHNFVFVDENGIVDVNSVVLKPMFYNKELSVISNIANWVHGVFVSYVISTNPKIDEAILHKVDSSIIIKNLEVIKDYVLDEYSADSYISCDYFNRVTVEKLIKSIDEFIEDPSRAKAMSLLSLMDAGSYGDAGDINLFVPINFRAADANWAKILTSGDVIYYPLIENFSEVMLGSLGDFIPDDIVTVFKKQIIADLNTL